MARTIRTPSSTILPSFPQRCAIPTMQCLTPCVTSRFRWKGEDSMWHRWRPNKSNSPVQLKTSSSPMKGKANLCLSFGAIATKTIFPASYREETNLSISLPVLLGKISITPKTNHRDVMVIAWRMKVRKERKAKAWRV